MRTVVKAAYYDEHERDEFWEPPVYKWENQTGEGSPGTHIVYMLEEWAAKNGRFHFDRNVEDIAETWRGTAKLFGNRYDDDSDFAESWIEIGGVFDGDCAVDLARAGLKPKDVSAPDRDEDGDIFEGTLGSGYCTSQSGPEPGMTIKELKDRIKQYR